MKKNNNKKTWKKTHRQRAKFREIIVKIKLEPELAKQFQEYRLKRGLSEQKAMERILKFAYLTHKQNGGHLEK